MKKKSTENLTQIACTCVKCGSDTAKGYNRAFHSEILDYVYCLECGNKLGQINKPDYQNNLKFF